MNLPPETLATLSNINNSLKKLQKAVNDFTNISYDEHLQRPAIEQAEIHMSAMYATVALAAINEKLQGNDPGNNDELQVEIKRVQKLEARLKEQRDKNLRPRLNPYAAKAFVRNAMFDVNEPSKKNNENENMEVKEEAEDNDSEEEQQEEVRVKEENMDDE
uniref:Nuclear nucleic acid-binding protein C1D n=1 Tax=Panagrolaimus superbus TaxID=310955 RepID=A0A914YNE5_9BILA